LRRLLLAAACVGAIVQCQASPPPPNLLLIVTDTLRADALSCYGGRADTPHICDLAERGVLFEAAYSNGPWTPPSAASIFTGNYPMAYADVESSDRASFWVSDDELLLGEALRLRGYDVFFGSGSPLVTSTNVLQGFERLPNETRRTDAGGRTVDTRSGRYLRNHDGTPFFLLEWFMNPHAPYEASGILDRLELDRSRLSQPLEFYTRLGHQVPPRMREHAPQMSDYELEVLRSLYLAEVEAVDEKVGTLLRDLDAAGLVEGSYVVFTSDHGEAFGEHGAFLHGRSLHDELVRVPLIIAGPGVARGKRVRTTVSLVDLMPTLRDLLSVECLNDPQGRSLRPLIVGENGGEAPGTVHYLGGPTQATRGVDALVDGDYKLIARLDGTSHLYDVAEDPGELRDLAAERPDVVSRMRADLDRIRRENHEIRRRNFTRRTEGERLEVHEQTLEALRELGYIE
jgi:arylsulfatase A-like enzyme